jgi:short subunit dehydrogenase-like uncharacterized protein
MRARIVVFGATGYTGRLVLAELVALGCRPLVAGRGERQVEALAAEYGGLDAAVADATRPGSVRALVGRGDVLVSTVGPYSVYGRAALDAAVDAGAHYLDAAGEAGFIRELFAQAGPRAEAAGCVLLPGFGFDFVPGNLAGALAARDAGQAARRLDVGYFFLGGTRLSSGTMATAAFTMQQHSHALRGGRLVTLPFAAELRAFADGARRREALLFGGTEPLTLPAVAPQLADVTTYLGGFGALTPGVRLAARATPPLLRVPVVGAGLRAAQRRALRRTGTGPDAATRARGGTLILAVAADAAGRELARVRLQGGDPYGFTGRMMAAGAHRLATGDPPATGALGPVDALGLDELERVCATAGLRRA